MFLARKAISNEGFACVKKQVWNFRNGFCTCFFVLKSVFSVNPVNLNTNFIPQVLECIYQKQIFLARNKIENRGFETEALFHIKTEKRRIFKMNKKRLIAFLAAGVLIQFVPNLAIFLILRKSFMNTMAHSGIK